MLRITTTLPAPILWSLWVTETPLADCTITFNAGGGSGSMDSVTVKAETNYILPACGFTAPDDQEFKAWEIGGKEYKVGDSYTVNEDTEIKALWENSVIPPPPTTSP